ncbi:MAG: hypothetical protein JWR44_1868 [Hymenobacter sp.]|nr:hypothetical protein [Hymenobacter sp.]
MLHLSSFYSGWFPRLLGIATAGLLAAASARAQTFVSTLAGSGVAGALDAPGTQAQFNNPRGVAADQQGNVYVADTFNHRIRKIGPGGLVTTIAGTGVRGYLNGPGVLAQLDTPRGIIAEANGAVTFTDSGNGCVRRIDANGVVSTLAGTGVPGYLDGPGAQARFNTPIGIVSDGTNYYVCDASNFRIRKIDAAGTVTTLAGSGVRGYLDGPGATAQFMEPQGIGRDLSGNLYVADRAAHRVRLVVPSGYVFPFAGTGNAGFADGLASQAQFNSPVGVTVANLNDVLVIDRDNHRIRQVDGNRQVSTLVGSGVAGFADGPATQAQLNSPYSLALAPNSPAFVADAGNHRVRRWGAMPTASLAAAGSPSNLVLWPNPSAGPMQLRYDLPVAGPVQVVLLDGTGRIVRQLVDATHPKGAHEVSCDLSDLPAGYYFLRLNSGTNYQAKPILLTR